MNVSRFRAPPSRRLLVLACLCAASLMGLTTSAQAGSLLPGAFIANDGSTVTGSPTVVADTTFLPYTMVNALSATVGTGFVREIVVSGDTSNPSNAMGGLTFLYQFKQSTGDVSTLTLSSFKGFLTDASAVLQSALAATIMAKFDPTTTPDGLLAPTGTPISRNTNGDSVIFDYRGVSSPPGVVSAVAIIRTNATTVTVGNIALQEGGNANNPGFAPNPEPGTLAIFGIGLVSMAGYGWRRKRRQLA